MLIYNSPQLIAVNRVLLRLLMPRHSPYALVRLNFLLLFSLRIVWVSLLNILVITLREKAFLVAFFWILPPCNFLLWWNCSFCYPSIGKTLNSIDLVNLMSSISVRFNSFLFSYSIFNERKDLIPSDSILLCHRGLKFQLFAVLPRSLAPGTAGWSVWMDPNRRPHNNA